MTKNDWPLLMDIVDEHIRNLEREKVELPEEELADFEDYEERVYSLFARLGIHIKYIKEITHWRDFMDKDKAIQYLIALSAPGIDKPDCECGFRGIPEAS